jgi:sugar lactone lactonase YvrE
VIVRLPPKGSDAGVDGIALDTSGTRLLVPDSPHGTLYAYDFATRRKTLLTSFLGRAVAAAQMGNHIYIAVEGVPGLMIVAQNGGRANAAFGVFPQADDVIAANGLLYVTLIGAGELVAIDPVIGTRRVLVRDMREPQGLTQLPDGRLLVSDSARGEIRIVQDC